MSWIQRGLVLGSLVSFVGLVAPGLALAQDALRVGAPTEAPEVSDSLVVLVPMRSNEDIQKDLEGTAEDTGHAEAYQQQARILQLRADTAIKVKTSEISTLKAQTDLAKKEKDEGKKSELESKIKLAELEKDLLQRRKALRDREIAMYQTSGEAADAARKAFESELQLAQTRQMSASVTDRAASPEVLQQVQKMWHSMQDLERKTLDLQIAAVQKRQDLVKQQVEVVKARRQIFDVQSKLSAGYSR